MRPRVPRLRFSRRSVLFACSGQHRGTRAAPRHGQLVAAITSIPSPKVRQGRVSHGTAQCGCQDASRPCCAETRRKVGASEGRAPTRVCPGEGGSYAARRLGGLRRCWDEVCARGGDRRRRRRAASASRWSSIEIKVLKSMLFSLGRARHRLTLPLQCLKPPTAPHSPHVPDSSYVWA
jgi:hypothetical protein